MVLLPLLLSRVNHFYINNSMPTRKTACILDQQLIRAARKFETVGHLEQLKQSAMLLLLRRPPTDLISIFGLLQIMKLVFVIDIMVLELKQTENLIIVFFVLNIIRNTFFFLAYQLEIRSCSSGESPNIRPQSSDGRASPISRIVTSPNRGSS